VYKVYILPQAIKDLNQLDKKFLTQIRTKINNLSTNPRLLGCLKLTKEEGYRIRSGYFRILYRIDDKKKFRSFLIFVANISFNFFWNNELKEIILNLYRKLLITPIKIRLH
jgi:mRNA interferase RelE/StbE